MKYFNHVETLEDLKSEFRRLAMENHPDRGGKVEAMQEINAEFELAFLVMKKKGMTSSSFWAGFDSNDSASSFRREFYTQNGWAGSRYVSGLRLRDIAPLIRGYVKDVHPSWKFSVTQEHSSWTCALYVCLMEAPVPIFADEGIRRYAQDAVLRRKFHGSVEEAFAHYHEKGVCGYLQNWNWYYDWMTDRAKAVLTDVEELVQSYRYDDSDARFDHYDTNFYANYYIGKFDRPLRIVPKVERLQTSQGPLGAKRIVG
jgi:hypothetical protein